MKKNLNRWAVMAFTGMAANLVYQYFFNWHDWIYALANSLMTFFVVIAVNFLLDRRHRAYANGASGRQGFTCPADK